MKRTQFTYLIWLLAFTASVAVGVRISPVYAATRFVVNNNDSGPGSLRQAILLANRGDTIEFDLSLAGSTITLTSGELTVDKDVIINGLGAESLTISGNNASGVFAISAGAMVTISGLTISDAFRVGISGGAISNTWGVVTVIKSTLSGNTGGAILNFNLGIVAVVTVIESTLSGNTNSSGGAIVNSEGAVVTIIRSTLSGNTASSSGGAIDNSEGAVVLINESTLSGNMAVDGGGIANSPDGTVTINKSTLSNNAASNRGGAIFNKEKATTIVNSKISGNAAVDGGGIFNIGTVQLTDTKLKKNVPNDCVDFLIGTGCP